MAKFALKTFAAMCCAALMLASTPSEALQLDVDTSASVTSSPVRPAKKAAKLTNDPFFKWMRDHYQELVKKAEPKDRKEEIQSVTKHARIIYRGMIEQAMQRNAQQNAERAKRGKEQMPELHVYATMQDSDFSSSSKLLDLVASQQIRKDLFQEFIDRHTLDRDFDVNERYNGRTALHQIAMNPAYREHSGLDSINQDGTGILLTLLNVGTDLSRANGENAEVLCSHPDIDVNALYLDTVPEHVKESGLSKFKKEEKKGPSGKTALMLAIEAGNFEVVDLLLARDDTDIFYKNPRTGQTAQQLAQIAGWQMRSRFDEAAKMYRPRQIIKQAVEEGARWLYWWPENQPNCHNDPKKLQRMEKEYRILWYSYEELKKNPNKSWPEAHLAGINRYGRDNRGEEI